MWAWERTKQAQISTSVETSLNGHFFRSEKVSTAKDGTCDCWSGVHLSDGWNKPIRHMVVKTYAREAASESRSREVRDCSTWESFSLIAIASRSGSESRSFSYIFSHGQRPLSVPLKSTRFYRVRQQNTWSKESTWIFRFPLDTKLLVPTFESQDSAWPIYSILLSHYDFWAPKPCCDLKSMR